MDFYAPQDDESSRNEGIRGGGTNTSTTNNNGRDLGVARAMTMDEGEEMEDDTAANSSTTSPHGQNQDHHSDHHRHDQKQEKDEDQEASANKERRSSIQFILKDPNLTNEQRRHSIQILMDPRRRSSFGSTFTEAARNVVADFAYRSGSSSNSSHSSYASCDEDGSDEDGSDEDGGNIIGRSVEPPSIASNTVVVIHPKARNDGLSSCSNHDDYTTTTATDTAFATTNDNTNNQDQKMNFEEYQSYYHLSSPQVQSKSNAAVAYSMVTGEPIGDTKQLEYNRPKCSHYIRHCSIISPCCGMVFGCRLCHNECEEQGMPFMKQLKFLQLEPEADEQADGQDMEEPKKRKRLKNENDTRYSNGREETTTRKVAAAAKTETREEPNQETGCCSIEVATDTARCHSCTDTNDTDKKMSSVVSSSDESNALKKKGRRSSLTRRSRRRSSTSKKFSRRFSLSSVTTNGGDDVHHEINRFDIHEIICRNCFKRQSSKTNACISCNIEFGEYHCSICNLWMEKKDEPYHCHECGICRVGGKNNYKHCNSCGMCIEKSLFSTHNCTAGKLMSNCPVCFEDLFSSRTACHELPCNHSIHWDCYRELSSVDIRCPICKKTMVQEEYRNELWRGLREDVEAQPVPPDQTRVVDVVCNDCEMRECDRRWHPLGVHCSRCSSFNTSIDFKMVGQEAFDYLAVIEETRDRMDQLDVMDAKIEPSMEE